MKTLNRSMPELEQMRARQGAGTKLEWGSVPFSFGRLGVCMFAFQLVAAWWPSAGLAGDLEEGARLASEIRSAVPAEEVALRGRLNVRNSAGTTRDVPFEFKTTLTASNWSTLYKAASTDSQPQPLLAVRRQKEGPNTYAEASPTTPDNWKPLAGKSIHRAFAGSDFSLFDLGVEFFHWPAQKIRKTEMRKSRSCHVLESLNPSPGPEEYLRVVSWIDVESGGVVVAEAYDAQNRLLKEFAVNSMKKINDRWQVQQMEIRNVQTRSRTRLDFEIR